MKVIDYSTFLKKRVQDLERKVEEVGEDCLNIASDLLIEICEDIVDFGITHDNINDLTETLKDYKQYKKYGIM